MQTSEEYSIVESQVVSMLRFPLAIMVICIHSGIPCATNYLIILFSHVLSRVAVPLFFLFSGYYFFTGLHEWNWKIWKSKIVKRVRTLLIPYLLWNVLYILIYFAPGFVRGLFAGHVLSLYDWVIDIGGLHLLWDSSVWNTDKYDMLGRPALYSGPILIPFWFIRDLMVTILLTPMIHLVLRNRNNKCGNCLSVLFFIVMSLLFFTSVSLHVYVPGLSPIAILFFSIGAFFQIRSKSIINFLSTYGRSLSVCAIILLVLSVIYDGNNTVIGGYIYNPWIFFGVFAALYLASSLARRSEKISMLLQKYSDATFFIFAIHSLLIQYLKIILNQIMKRIYNIEGVFDVGFSIQHPLLYTVIYVAIVILTVYFSIVIFKFCKKHIPRICNILTGR